MNIEKSIEEIKIQDLIEHIRFGTQLKYDIKDYIYSIETLLTAYEKEKEKNKEILEQNKDMKSLFNIQASIAKELDFNTKAKMVKFKDEYYVPDTMAINANIGEPKTIELRYISATKYLTKFDEEE